MNGPRLAALVLVLIPATAAADGEADRARARVLVDEGNAMFRDGQHDEAIQRFEAALAIYDSPKIHVNIAEAHRATGRLDVAMRHYEIFITRGTSKPKIARRIEARAAEIEPKIARVELSGALESATVTIGDWTAPWREGWRIPVSAGDHVVQIKQEGREPHRRQITVAAGALLPLSIEVDLDSTPPIDLRPRASTAPSNVVVATTADDDEVTSKWWFWTGIGAVVVVVAGIAVVAATTGGDDYLPTGELPRSGTSEWERL